MSWRFLFALGLALVAACASARSGGSDIDAADDDSGVVDDAGIDAIDAMACARTPCDILSQCGCTNAQAPVCDLDFNQLPVGATTCRANLLNGTETTTCSATNTCGPLHVCVVGRCRKYCDDDNDCAGPGGICLIKLTYGNPPMDIPMAPLTCTTDCNPVTTTNATCPANWACHIYVDDPTPPPGGQTGDERYLTDCDSQGGVGVGGACTSNRSCNAGLDCINLNPGGLQCHPTCVCPGGNCAGGSCPGGTGSCRGYTTPVVINGVTYGACF